MRVIKIIGSNNTCPDLVLAGFGVAARVERQHGDVESKKERFELHGR
jgi:hypothetical protein